MIHMTQFLGEIPQGSTRTLREFQRVGESRGSGEGGESSN